MLARGPQGLQGCQNVVRGDIRYRARPERTSKLCEAVAPLVAVLGIRQRLDTRRLKHAVRDFAERNASSFLNASRLHGIAAKRQLAAPSVAKVACILQAQDSGVAQRHVTDAATVAIAAQPSPRRRRDNEIERCAVS